MSTGQMQQRNAQNVRLLSGDFQLRYEPNFAWKSACSAFLALPALRAFWPMSSVDYTAADRAKDVSGNGYHLTDNNTPQFGHDSLAPFCDFDGANQNLTRADGGAATWADITGTETYVQSTVRGLTLGGWFYFSSAAPANQTYLICKRGLAGQRGYFIRRDTLAGGSDLQFGVSVDGTAEAFAITGTAVPTQTWLFIVGRFVPSTSLTLFENDVLTTNLVAIPASIFDNTALFAIASSSLSTLYLDGRASMCFLCAAQLSDAIILSLFHQTRAMYGV